MRPSNDLPAVYLCREAVDFRKGINGLAALVEEVLNLDPFSEQLSRRYAARSEKISPDQLALFDEAETEVVSAGVDADPEQGDGDADTVEIAAHSGKKRGRKPLPDTLPRLEVVHEMPEAERVCTHDGRNLNDIGETVCEQFDIVPATIRVIRHIRRKYACQCGRCIRTSARSPPPRGSLRGRGRDGAPIRPVLPPGVDEGAAGVGARPHPRQIAEPGPVF